MNTLMVAGGAVLGALSRHGFNQLFTYLAPGFAYGTIAANTLGSFIIGFILPFLHRWPEEWRLFLVTGFLGSLTTLSSLHAEILLMTETKRWAAALSHWLIGACLCLLLCYLGHWLAQRFFQPSLPLP